MNPIIEESALSRRSDPETSVEAAASVQVGALESIVYRAICERPATSTELSERLGLSLVTVSPRLRPLCNKGLIVDSGERRSGTSGRKSIVWRRSA
jgi:predicted transcriptional regulator